MAYFRNQNDPLVTCNMTRLKVDMRTSEEECRVVQNNFFRQTTWRSVCRAVSTITKIILMIKIVFMV